MSIIGRVADIQRASVHDGYGIRTTVFFKGCPLNCLWCHNPECISFEKQIMAYPEKCIGCGMCDKGCYSGAKVICGKDYSPSQLVKEILIDKDYFKNNGGVTFSGGEPLAQRDFLSEAVRLCKESGIGCAIETSLFYYDEAILKEMDFIIADLKIWDNSLHKEYTGAGNKEIIENFKKVNELNIPIIARTPVIPEIKQDIDKISDFLFGLGNVVKYELLPYHSLGIPKRKALFLPITQFQIPDKLIMERLNQYAFIR